MDTQFQDKCIQIYNDITSASAEFESARLEYDKSVKSLKSQITNIIDVLIGNKTICPKDMIDKYQEYVDDILVNLSLLKVAFDSDEKYNPIKRRFSQIIDSTSDYINNTFGEGHNAQ